MAEEWQLLTLECSSYQVDCIIIIKFWEAHWKTFIYKICFCQLTVKTLQLEDGRMIQAAKYGQDEEAAEAIELTEEEKVMEAKLRVMWKFYFV